MLTSSTEFFHKYRFHIVFLTLSALLSMVSSEGVVLLKGGEKFLFPEDNNINVYKREVQFYNLCSERQLQIVGSTVDARGKHDSPYAVMILTNAPHYGNKYGFYIFGKNSRRYLCFNKKSKLIARFTASPRCVFEEMFSPKGALFSVLKSVYNETLSVGFNKNGKPLLGFKHSKYDKRDKNKCFYFSKRSSVLKDFMKVRHRHGPKINVNKLSHYLLQQRLKRKRRWMPRRKTSK